MDWKRTEAVLSRLEDKVQQNNFYEGRPIIQRDSPIDGGVYLGGHEREAIVVDSVKYPLIGLVYQEVKALCVGKDHQTTPAIILGTVFNTVKLRLRYSERETKKTIVGRGAANDRKISLGAFLDEQYGVCRQQALLTAFLLEKFIKEGYLEGKVSVDRNSWALGVHAWCRYTNKEGEVIIIDAAHNFIGSLEASLKCGKWDYRREDDRKTDKNERE